MKLKVSIFRIVSFINIIFNRESLITEFSRLIIPKNIVTGATSLTMEMKSGLTFYSGILLRLKTLLFAASK